MIFLRRRNVIASEAKQSTFHVQEDCFVADIPSA
jgi:hypothetical protein